MQVERLDTNIYEQSKYTDNDNDRKDSDHSSGIDDPSRDSRFTQQSEADSTIQINNTNSSNIDISKLNEQNTKETEKQ